MGDCSLLEAPADPFGARNSSGKAKLRGFEVLLWKWTEIGRDLALLWLWDYI